MAGKMLVNGVELHYESRGSGSQVVLCIPGALGTARSDFPPQMDYFGSRENFRIVAFDPPGPEEAKFKWSGSIASVYNQ